MKQAILVAAAAMSLTAAAPCGWGQAPSPILNCKQTRLYVNGLVPYCEIRQMAVPLNESLTVETVNGNILVQPWDGQDALVRAQVQTAAANESLADGLAALVTVQTSTGNVTGKGPSTSGRETWSLSFEIYLPARAALSVTTVNGNLTITGMTGAIQFKTVNGSTKVTGASGNLQGRGVNGNITVSAADPWQGQTIDVQTVNGNIELNVPADCSAHVELSTVMGNIATSVPAPLSGSVAFGRKLSFDLGNGGPLVRAATTLGNLQLSVGNSE